ncbi:S26 family signal peptidase [Streptomyces actinomycinicus]|uniref:S26 family signal peptidase n=1 Tax=Streptomyces actinomycinicus TaxID=1695166 RepID=A0A937EFY4_9ACTN|nr:S26 family signal peptidase [Streptomyces actinomycinicus]MBL1082293.1 S26 family signal peptidase [Streptomyces actinomycinicus]
MTRDTAARTALGGICAVATAVALLRRRYVVVTVEGESMTPTLVAGDRVVVRRTGLAAVRSGQLVVAGPPTGERWDRLPLPEWLIKRAVAVPGDRVPKDAGPALGAPDGERVPDGRLVLLGDNPNRSLDSRHLGYFASGQLLGVVVRRIPRSAAGAGRIPSSPGRGRAVPGRTHSAWRT